MHCNNCGKEINENDKFCSNCGKTNSIGKEHYKFDLRKKIIIIAICLGIILIVLYLFQHKSYVKEVSQLSKETEQLIISDVKYEKLKEDIENVENFKGPYTSKSIDKKLEPIVKKINEYREDSEDKFEIILNEINSIDISETEKNNLKVNEKIEEANEEFTHENYKRGYDILYKLKDKINTNILIAGNNEQKLEININNELNHIEDKNIDFNFENEYDYLAVIDGNSNQINTIEDGLLEYLGGMVTALNNKDFSYVEPYIIINSPAYKEQKKYVGVDIYEELLYAKIISYNEVSYDIVDIKVYEEYDIHNEKDGYHFRSIEAVYRFKLDINNKWKLYSFPEKVKVISKGHY